MYKVELRRDAQKVLDKLPKQYFQAIITAIKGLSENPRPRGMENIKSTGLWRIRQGDYRIIYFIQDDFKSVIIVRIGHRREIYRSL